MSIIFLLYNSILYLVPIIRFRKSEKNKRIVIDSLEIRLNEFVFPTNKVKKIYENE